MKPALLLPLLFGFPVAALACDPVEPEAILTLVKTIAVEEELDPALALAVVDVESADGRHQVSDAGAVGIMQLMPETAADYGVTDRCDQQSNIRAGIRYLKKLNSEFDDPLLMLAAYNAGPERVYQKGGIPEFNETANYIVKVMNRWTLNAKATAAQEKRSGGNNQQNATIALAPSPWRDEHVWSAE
ncbi:lytic transglycosylase domain-containing protein [Pararhizobium sp. YC-54]|uniref:lytic transglycosylase domain-containing protein n=1 Tax=Pararhizobium sp. YC-54 TaxID=2986920 RepID=UPI0021F7CD24|nr:lytic transglycosylase domain-containing protein [Pararhizobium sp. YC-54]MCW0001480.1 lytic transglycosylase domain-containing protein [Pararhizobium sp. YC-54]